MTSAFLGVQPLPNNVAIESSEVTQSLFEHAPVAMLLIDPAGNIQGVNAAAELLFGFNKSELVGQTVELLVPVAARHRHMRLRHDFMRSPNARPMGEGRRLTARLKDGREIPISVGLNPVSIAGAPVVIVTSVVDNSAQERAERAELLVRELTHRAKNMFAVISALSHQVGAMSTDIPSFQKQFDDRLKSLSVSHDLLVRENWQDVSIAELVRSQLAFVSGSDVARIAVEGPALRLSPNQAEYLGLALHELATNAVKYGALSVPMGKISAVWKADEAARQLLFEWREVDGPPAAEPKRKGFGSIILKTIVPAVFRGTTEVRYQPQGLIWQLKAPFDHFSSEEVVTEERLGGRS